MPTKIRLIDRLPRIAVTIQANGQSITLENVLIDTGSVTTVFKTDQLSQVGIGLLDNDIVHTMYGIGGREFVIAKRLDTLYIGDLVATFFPIQMSGMSYAPELDGIIGSNFLLQTGAIIDFKALEIRRG